MAAGAFESTILNGRRFSCDAGDTPKVKLSGFKNEVITHSDGTFDTKGTYTAGKISGVKLAVRDDEDGQEFLQELANRIKPFPFNATKVDGTVLFGEVVITSDIEVDASQNYVEVTLEGRVEKMG